MVVVWSNFAKQNLKNFITTTLMTKENSTKYVKRLVEYVGYLDEQSFLGKVLTKYNDITIYQLIYKQHRIIYSIDNNKIYIISVLHTAQSPEKTLTSIKEFFDN